MAAAIIRTLSVGHAHICITGGRGGHRGPWLTRVQDAGIDWSRSPCVVVGRAFSWRWVTNSATTPWRMVVLLDVVRVPVANVHSMPSPDQYADVGEAARAYVRETRRVRGSVSGVLHQRFRNGRGRACGIPFPEHAGLADERVASAVTGFPKPPRCAFRCPFYDQRGRGSGTHRIRGGKADAVGIVDQRSGSAGGARRGVHGKHLTVLKSTKPPPHICPGVVC